MRLVRWGDVWVFWDTSSQTAVRLRIRSPPSAEDFSPSSECAPPGPPQKRRPIVGDALVARTRYSNSSRSRTPSCTALPSPLVDIVFVEKDLPERNSGRSPKPIIRVSPDFRDTSELKPGVAGFGKFFFPGPESTSAISWPSAFRWFRSTAPWGLSAFPPNPPKTADSDRSCGCGNSGACDSRGRFRPSSEATIPHS